MNQDNLNNDLYYYDSDDESNRGWIGLYIQLKNINSSRDSLISQLASCASRYATCKSNYENAKLLLNAIEEELEELYDDFADITGKSWEERNQLTTSELENEEISGIIYNIERLT
jgi:chromosome segregation ATPase